MKLRNAFWIWGQDPGCHHGANQNQWKLPGVNRVDAAKGAALLGIPNCCRIVVGDKPEPPFDLESAKLTGFREVAWSIMGDFDSKRNDLAGDDLDEVLRQADMFPNISGGVLDDFFPNGPRLSKERLTEIRDRLHGFKRKLKLWVVFYAGLLTNSTGFPDYLELCDVITFWTWDAAALERLEDNLDHFIKLTPGKERMGGCYLWDYGAHCPISDERMLLQLEIYRKYLHQKKLHGVVVCSSCVSDIGLRSADILTDWLNQHGDEEI